MPSPFPGMDPFLEDQEWEDFHTRFNTVIGERLAPSLEPRYVVRIERRVYVEHLVDEPSLRRADVAVLWTGAGDQRAPVRTGTETIAPVECLLPVPEERREAYLVVRDRETLEVVTVVETLSPANKRPGGDGRREYLGKREAVLQSQAHLVELDLLRGGARLPMADPLPPGDYYAIVSRKSRRPRADVYAWTVPGTLPPIPIPLSAGDPDVALDLQVVFTTVYDRARYDLSLDYRARLMPAPEPALAAWIADRLAAART
jgi:hypothetical protein